MSRCCGTLPENTRTTSLKLSLPHYKNLIGFNVHTIIIKITRIPRLQTGAGTETASFPVDTGAHPLGRDTNR